MSARRSLWLHPQGKPELISLDRFSSDAWFLDSFGQYGVELPEKLSVRWEPIEPYLMPFSDELDEAPDYIDWVKGYMKRGGNVPPILVVDGEVFDGRHRAWAAKHAGLELVPVVDITPYWNAARGR